MPSAMTGTLLGSEGSAMVEENDINPPGTSICIHMFVGVTVNFKISLRDKNCEIKS